jgi:hypothetical protein
MPEEPVAPTQGLWPCPACDEGMMHPDPPDQTKGPGPFHTKCDFCSFEMDQILDTTTEAHP